jgi:hypothetical protein
MQERTTAAPGGAEVATWQAATEALAGERDYFCAGGKRLLPVLWIREFASYIYVRLCAMRRRETTACEVPAVTDDVLQRWARPCVMCALVCAHRERTSRFRVSFAASHALEE